MGGVAHLCVMWSGDHCRRRGDLANAGRSSISISATLSASASPPGSMMQYTVSDSSKAFIATYTIIVGLCRRYRMLATLQHTLQCNT